MDHVRHSREELAAKLTEMYPEIRDHGVDLTIEFSHEKNAWLIHLKKGEHQLATHLEREDADKCLEGIQCVYLGVQIAQFIKNFEAGE